MLMNSSPTDSALKKAPTKRILESSAKNTVKKVKVFQDLSSQDLHPCGGFPSDHVAAEVTTGTVQEHLKVHVPASIKIANYLTPESVAYYAQLGLDESFALSMVPDWVYAAGPFAPVPLQPSEIAQFFVTDKLDYDLMVNILYPSSKS